MQRGRVRRSIASIGSTWMRGSLGSELRQMMLVRGGEREWGF
jgi:hypothetical protein